MRTLRLSLLALVAQVLRRWLNAVSAQLQPAADAPAPPAPAEDAGQQREPLPAGTAGSPAPPDHWVELVRQHAPQLLDPDSADQSGVIEWRSDAALLPPQTPPQVVTRARRAPPLRLQAPPERPAAAPPVVKTSHRRPLRLQSVTAQPLDADEISVHPAGTEAPEVDPPVRAAPSLHAAPTADRPSSAAPGRDQPKASLKGQPDASEAFRLLERSPADVPAETVREVTGQPDASDEITAHFATLPYERQTIRETYTSVPPSAAVPTIRTSAAGTASLNQRRTAIPQAPPQVVLRPTLSRAPLNVGDVSAERWPSLPDEPAEDAPDPAINRQRRERLRRQQEGRSWSE